MSDLTFNKIAGATLATALAVFGLKEVSAVVFAPHELDKAGYAIVVPEETGAGAAEVEVPPDWGTVLPIANVQAGQASFAKCVSCHTNTQGGANGTGPNLWGVVGGRPAGKAGFAYSAAFNEFSATHPQWTDEQLYEYLKAPAKHIPGTKMTFIGLKQQEERINVIAYLRTLGGTLPVPAPNPAAAAPPAAPGEAPAAEGAAAEGAPVATGETATPPATAGGPAGQAPTTGAAQAPTTAPAKTAVPN